MRVVLDYGGTVTEPVDDSLYSVGETGHVERPEYVAYKAFSLGLLSNEEEYISALSRLTGAPEERCRRYLEERKAAVEVPEARVEAVRRLARDHSLALFTDQVDVWVDEVLERHGIADVFDDVVVSNQLGYEKPYPEGYLHVAEGFDDVWMVSDELHDDLLMADHLGMTTVWIPRQEERVVTEPDHRIDDLAELPELLEEEA